MTTNNINYPLNLYDQNGNIAFSGILQDQFPQSLTSNLSSDIFKLKPIVTNEIDGTISGSYLIVTIPSDFTQNFSITRIDAICTAFSGILKTAPIISVGYNSPLYDNISATNALPSLLNLPGNSMTVSTLANKPTCTPGISIYVNVSSIATFITTGNYKFKIVLSGNYI